MSKAHELDAKRRTRDIAQTEAASFDDLLLSEPVLRGLAEAGYRTPSPIQLKAIPLGRCGLDLVVQSKAGTGKTCVFAVLALEWLAPDFAAPGANVLGIRVLALSPTREVALQSRRAIEAIGCQLKGLRCGLFIGGVKDAKEKEAPPASCQVAVGTPGRVRQLIETGALPTERVRMLVLDEADALLNESFEQDINWIYSSLPLSKQVLALSATYPEAVTDQLSLYMRDPSVVRLSGGQLLGVRPYWSSVPHSHLPNLLLERKARLLSDLLSRVQFGQCLVFSNYQDRARDLCQRLESAGWPVAYLAGRLHQAERTGAYDRLRDFRCRVLVATDVAARGLDAENVDLVVNLDLPRDHRTLLHRIGRAGRYGSYAAAVSLVGDGPELQQLRDVERLAGLRMTRLPDPPPPDLTKAAASDSGDANAAATFIELDEAEDFSGFGNAPSGKEFSPFHASSSLSHQRHKRQQRSWNNNKKKKNRQQQQQQQQEIKEGFDPDSQESREDWAAFEAHSAAADSLEDAEVLRLRALLLGGGGDGGSGGGGGGDSSSQDKQAPPPAPSPLPPPPPPPPPPQPLPLTESSGDPANIGAVGGVRSSMQSKAEAFRSLGEKTHQLAQLLAGCLDSRTAPPGVKRPANMRQAADILNACIADPKAGRSAPTFAEPDPTVVQLLTSGDSFLTLDEQIKDLKSVISASTNAAIAPSEVVSTSAGISSAPTEIASAPTAVASASTTVTPAPAGIASAPAAVASAPIGIGSAPAVVTSAPTGIASTPFGIASAPAGISSAPAAVTSAPHGITSAPTALVSAPAEVASPAAAATAAAAVAALNSRPLSLAERQLLRELLSADAELTRLRRLTAWHRRGCQRELALMRLLRSQLSAGGDFCGAG